MTKLDLIERLDAKKDVDLLKAILFVEEEENVLEAAVQKLSKEDIVPLFNKCTETNLKNILVKYITEQEILEEIACFEQNASIAYNAFVRVKNPKPVISYLLLNQETERITKFVSCINDVKTLLQIIQESNDKELVNVAKERLKLGDYWQLEAKSRIGKRLQGKDI